MLIECQNLFFYYSLSLSLSFVLSIHYLLYGYAVSTLSLYSLPPETEKQKNRNFFLQNTRLSSVVCVCVLGALSLSSLFFLSLSLND